MCYTCQFVTVEAGKSEHEGVSSQYSPVHQRENRMCIQMDYHRVYTTYLSIKYIKYILRHYANTYKLQ